MDERIVNLVERTQEKFGLTNYYLARKNLNREVNIRNETNYNLVMEWFPNQVSEIEPEDEELNPEGTAIIEMDIHAEMYHSVIFVGGETFADGVQFKTKEKAEIIDWVEEEMDLTYERHFTLIKNEANTYQFHACIDGIRTFPPGIIEVKINENGHLTFFSKVGDFPNESLVQKDTYHISLDKINNQAKEQAKLIHYPIEEDESLLPIYALEEAFLTNDTLELLPFDAFTDDKNRLFINDTLYWNESLQGEVERQLLDFEEEVTIEEAYAQKPAPESMPITSSEQAKSFQAVYQVLQREYPDSSGEWLLQSLHRDARYVNATLRKVEQSAGIFKRKLTIVIDDETFEPLNYIDNNMMLEMFADYKSAGDIKVTKEAAYEKIYSYIHVTPYYVFDHSQKIYRLCGLLDCDEAIDATNGNVINLNNL